MDYHAIHGHDIASFDTPSTHRLPTIAASQALDELKDDHAVHISTGIDALDKALLSFEPVDSQESALNGGIKRGQVTEVWGPPGCGKTALGIQLAANTLSDGHDVVWVDCFQRVQNQRISNALQNVKESRNPDAGDAASHDVETGTFTQYSCFALPHLLALISRPTTTSIPTNVSLIVISSLSALINTALPRSLDGKATSRPPTKGPTPSAKRLQGLQFIINALQKLAATRNLAVVLLSQCATRMQSEQGATLVPAINATVWEQGVSTRLVLFRDWTWHDKKSTSVFLAGLQKIDGRAAQEAIEHVSAFKVEVTGISGVHYEATHPSYMDEVATIRRRPKRKRGQSGLEVPDSEDDEDYGWADEDEDALPPPPSQWQGSEDLILGQDVGLSEDEEPEEPYDDDDDGGGDDEVGDEHRSSNETDSQGSG
ncbi:hypothetical protein PT974_00957 [Cladobotryum mycophilum]|uniref:RecA family profile 1 domain-containing protein n=1 Tax=Cladobotryum mycophilum TaxID=491253 RepID=A0ABR0T2B9_9HYPO